MKYLYLYILASVAATALLGTMTQSAFAADEHSGFGEAASTIGSDNGCHASSFAGEPRIGIGNVPELFGLDSVWELGTLLLSLLQGGTPLPGC